MAKNIKNNQSDNDQVAELTADLQRIQADFINYRRRTDEERAQLSQTAKAATIIKLLPLLDDIERAISHVPGDLSDNAWAQGIVALGKRFEKSLQDLGLTRIAAGKGVLFDPARHEAVSMEEGDGDQEVISEELRAGYMLGGQVVRPSMVKVTHQVAAKAASADEVEEVLENQLQEEPEESAEDEN